MEPRHRVATRLGRSDSAPSHRLLEGGNRERYNTDRINSVEDLQAELDERLRHINERLDCVLDGIQLMSRVVERNQEMANQNADVVGQVQGLLNRRQQTSTIRQLRLPSYSRTQHVQEMAARVVTAVNKFQRQKTTTTPASADGYHSSTGGVDENVELELSCALQALALRVKAFEANMQGRFTQGVSDDEDEEITEDIEQHLEEEDTSRYRWDSDASPKRKSSRRQKSKS
ncbi:hypothetical protein PHYBOEH_002454 [Phytophthora boehmeriae]|uniref:Uncharacterized protein n=1 Tax=Phytophthora boehmeriae TaxID=109152 RepID=A0A8T1WT06_9STRA|nr:hypothetical protein PHYBOEH_002454 [Phytophthora boehmeriae]